MTSEGREDRATSCWWRIRMLLVDKLRSLKTNAVTSPNLVHGSLIIAVVIYTLFGAIVMRHLEWPDTTKKVNHRSVQAETDRNLVDGVELGDSDPQLHQCIRATLTGVVEGDNCTEDQWDKIPDDLLDHCYQQAASRATKSLNHPKEKASSKAKSGEETDEKWTFLNSVIFTFSVITTIGYGHVSPGSWQGQLFVMVYGLIGVPLTLLVIADLGMFFKGILQKVARFAKRKIAKLRRVNQRDGAIDQNEGEEEEEEGDSLTKGESLILVGIFVLYVLLGAYILASYEPDMDFFKATYFNFVTLTTVGLGDFVPTSDDYFIVTMLYITIGLTITTMCIDLASDYLKKLHYLGRKIENTAQTFVWFGGKKMTMDKLVSYLGQQLNIPPEQLKQFNLDQFVDSAVKVEAGEIETLRKPIEPPTPVQPPDIDHLPYVDVSSVATTTGQTFRTSDWLMPRLGDFGSVYSSALTSSERATTGDPVKEIKFSPMALNLNNGDDIIVPPLSLRSPLSTIGELSGIRSSDDSFNYDVLTPPSRHVKKKDKKRKSHPKRFKA